MRTLDADFGGTDLVVAVGSLANVQLAGLDIDVAPAQPAQLAGAQAGEARPSAAAPGAWRPRRRRPAA